jgi:hypothetical protein
MYLISSFVNNNRGVAIVAVTMVMVVVALSRPSTSQRAPRKEPIRKS